MVFRVVRQLPQESYSWSPIATTMIGFNNNLEFLSEWYNPEAEWGHGLNRIVIALPSSRCGILLCVGLIMTHLLQWTALTHFLRILNWERKCTALLVNKSYLTLLTISSPALLWRYFCKLRIRRYLQYNKWVSMCVSFACRLFTVLHGFQSWGVDCALHSIRISQGSTTELQFPRTHLTASAMFKYLTFFERNVVRAW